MIITAKSKNESGLISQVLISGALISVVLAGIGYVGVDIWLASTQWLLVSIVLGVFGVYTKR